MSKYYQNKSEWVLLHCGNTVCFHRLEDNQVGSDYFLFFVSKGYPAFFKSIVQILGHKLVTARPGVQKVDLVSCEAWIVSFPLQPGLLNFECSCE